MKSNLYPLCLVSYQVKANTEAHIHGAKEGLKDKTKNRAIIDLMIEAHV